MAIPLPARRFWPPLLLLAFCAIALPAISGDHPEIVYRTTATEVRLTFSASDQNDHGVATLQPSDFAVVDKGFIVRDFQSFTRSDYTKLEIAVMLDNSGSVQRSLPTEITQAVGLLAQSSGVPEEHISLLAFDDGKPSLLCAGTCRTPEAGARLSQTRASGMTPLFDSIVFASEFLSQRSGPRTQKVLILFSDGQDTFSLNSRQQAIDSSLTHDVQIYVVDVGNSIIGRQTLKALASASGGRYFLAQRGGATRALSLILDSFRASYSVSYRLPSHQEGFHTVQVMPTHNLNLQFRSRSGYFYPNYIR